MISKNAITILYCLIEVWSSRPVDDSAIIICANETNIQIKQSQQHWKNHLEHCVQLKAVKLNHNDGNGD